MIGIFKHLFSSLGRVSAKVFLFAVFSYFTSFSSAWALTFYWTANPVDEYVFGYRLYYGAESRYDWGEEGISLKSDFSYDFFVDPFFGKQCPAGTVDYSDCVDLDPDAMSCIPSPRDWLGSQGEIQCTMNGDLPNQVYYSSIRAYNINGEEGDFSQELSHADPQIFVTPMSNHTTEYGRSAFLLMALTGLPDNAEPVTVSLTGDDTEGSISPSSVTFTGNTDWIKLITVTGVEDHVVDGDIEYTIVPTIESEDPDYPLPDPDDITVVNEDNDAESADVFMYNIFNKTDEDGSFSIILVKLNRRPTAPVTVFFESDDLTEGTVFPSSLTFSGENGYYQAVVVTGVDDAEGDGDIEYHIAGRVESADPAFDALPLADIPLVNVDNDLKKIFPWGMFLPAILNNRP